jgi:hypothetical protein
MIGVKPPLVGHHGAELVRLILDGHPTVAGGLDIEEVN